MTDLISNNEIAIEDKDDAFKLTEILLRNNYVVCVSREECLYIINFVETCEFHEANRNGVVFMSREDFDNFKIEGEEND